MPVIPPDPPKEEAARPVLPAAPPVDPLSLRKALDQISPPVPPGKQDLGGAWLLLGFILANVINVALFAIAYLSLVKMLLSNNQVTAGVVITVTIAWFAFCGLLAGILGKVTLALIYESRLTASRGYIAKVMPVFQISGITPDTILRLVEHGVYHEHPDPDPTAALTPVIQAAKSVRDVASSLLPERK